MIDSLLDAFGYVGDSLDKLGPRPLRGLLGGKPREALSFVPFSDELGLTDPHDIQRGRDLTDKYGLTDPHDTGLGAHAAGFLTEALLDPLAFAGGATAAFKGGRHVVKDLLHTPRRGMMDINPFPHGSSRVNAMADRLGPQFPAKEGQEIVHEAMRPWLDKMAEHEMDPVLHNSLMGIGPDERRLLYQEIPPGSKPLASGAEGPALQTPQGHVIKLSPAVSHFGNDETNWARRNMLPPQGRPHIPEMLDPIRSNIFGFPDSGVSVEHLHKVDPLLNALSGISSMGGAMNSGLRIRRNADDIAKYVADQIRQNHPMLTPWDVVAKNVSLTPGNRAVIHDAGAVTRRVGGEHIDTGVLPGLHANPAERKQLMRMGSPEAVQQAMLQSIARGPRAGVEVPPHLLDQRNDLIQQLMELLGQIRQQGADAADLPPSQALLNALIGGSNW